MSYYVNPSSVYAVAILFIVLCTFGVALRFLSRKNVNIPFGIDDWLSVVALIFTIGCGVILIVGDNLKTIGYHSPQTTAEIALAAQNHQYQTISKLQFAFWPLDVLAIGFIRLVFAFFYKRIFRGKIIIAVIWGTIGLIVAWMIAFFFAQIFLCAPHYSAYWTTQAAFAQYCKADFNIYAAMSCADVIIDLALLILPIVPVWQLNMTSKRKLLILMVFALGIFSIGAGMARMILLMQILTYDYGSNDKLFGLAGTSDSLGVISTVLWWSFMEIGVGCLVSNLPPIIGLFRGKMGKVLNLNSILARVSLPSLRSTGSGGSGPVTMSSKPFDVESQGIHMASMNKEGLGTTREVDSRSSSVE